MNGMWYMRYMTYMRSIQYVDMLHMHSIWYIIQMIVYIYDIEKGCIYTNNIIGIIMYMCYIYINTIYVYIYIHSTPEHGFFHLPRFFQG